MFAVARWCKQLPVTASVTVFISPTIAAHLPSVSAATVHSRAARHWCVFTGACQFSTTHFSFLLSTIWGLCSGLWCVAAHWERHQSFKDAASVAGVILRGASVFFAQVWMRPPRKTLNHYVRLNHWDGNFPASFSGDFHFSLWVCLCVCVCVSEGGRTWDNLILHSRKKAAFHVRSLWTTALIAG